MQAGHLFEFFAIREHMFCKDSRARSTFSAIDSEVELIRLRAQTFVLNSTVAYTRSFSPNRSSAHPGCPSHPRAGFSGRCCRCTLWDRRRARVA